MSCTNPLFAAGSDLGFHVYVCIPPGDAAGHLLHQYREGQPDIRANDENNSSDSRDAVTGGTSADLSVNKTGPAAVRPGRISLHAPGRQHRPDTGKR